jgi:hypothetical protein
MFNDTVLDSTQQLSDLLTHNYRYKKSFTLTFKHNDVVLRSEAVPGTSDLKLWYKAGSTLGVSAVDCGDQRLRVGVVVEDSPLHAYPLVRTLTIIKAVNGVEILTSEQFTEILKDQAGDFEVLYVNTKTEQEEQFEQENAELFGLTRDIVLRRQNQDGASEF